MTTIAANLKGMAADRRVSDSDESGEVTGWSYPAKKLFRVGNSIWGTSGHGTLCLVFIEWLKTNRSRHLLYRQISEDSRTEFRVLELRAAPRPALYVWDGWGLPELVMADRLAIGSGAKPAGALLKYGASPEEAVKGAMGEDFFTGGHIDVELLTPDRKPKNQPKRRAQ